MAVFLAVVRNVSTKIVVFEALLGVLGAYKSAGRVRRVALGKICWGNEWPEKALAKYSGGVLGRVWQLCVFA